MHAVRGAKQAADMHSICERRVPIVYTPAATCTAGQRASCMWSLLSPCMCRTDADEAEAADVDDEDDAADIATTVSAGLSCLSHLLCSQQALHPCNHAPVAP
jgi:hypothetical protein